MNAQPDRQHSTGSTNQQAVDARTEESERIGTDNGGERSYLCSACGRQFDSFIRQCPDCGAREFRTGMPVESTETGDTQRRTERFETMMARLNPYIPR